MYNAKFISDNGTAFSFGLNNYVAFDIKGLSGNDVNVGTSQGFGQIGETVETQGLTGKPLTIKGVIFRNIPQIKKQMQKAFAPFQSGQLIFNDKYKIFVIVKSSPTFNPKKKNGAFSMQLFAPFPLWKTVDEKVDIIGGITPLFRFPVNYSEPHKFGERSASKYINIVNNGDMETPLKINIIADGTNSNVVISNLQTFEFLRFNGTLETGDEVQFYYDDYNQLIVELWRDGVKSDIIGWIDDDSTLYNLKVGDNIIAIDSDEGGGNLSVSIMHSDALGAVYED